MNFEHYLRQYNDFIIAAGFLVGALFIFDFIPKEIGFFDLGTNVKFVYIAIIALSGYTYYNFFWGKLQKAPVFTRTVAPRTLKTPHVTAKSPVESEYSSSSSGPTPNSNAPVVPMSNPSNNNISPPSKQIFDKFNKESE
jgi:hypothetical protein